jgi:hypothetical protein
MSLRAALRGLVLATAGAALVLAVAAAARPEVRRKALGLVGRGGAEEPAQPTHIVLPDRRPEPVAAELEEAVVEGRQVGADIALTGA